MAIFPRKGVEATELAGIESRSKSYSEFMGNFEAAISKIDHSLKMCMKKCQKFGAKFTQMLQEIFFENYTKHIKDVKKLNVKWLVIRE